LGEGAQSTIHVLANDVGGAARWTIESISDISGEGSVEIAADGKSVLYTPAVGSVGAETFTYAAIDNNGIAGTATVTVTFDSVNDPPVNIVPVAQTYNSTDRKVTFDSSRDTLRQQRCDSSQHHRGPHLPQWRQRYALLAL
jgi:hypothetical protein